MVDSIDLVSLVKSYQKLKGVIVYGQVECEVSRPVYLNQSVILEPDGKFLKMNLFAVDFSTGDVVSYLKQQGIANKDSIYMVNGSIVIYAKTTEKIIPGFYSLRGTMSASKSDERAINLFQWGKDVSNWVLKSAYLDSVDVSTWQENTRYMLYYHQSVDCGKIVVPDDIKELPEFCFEPRKSFTLKQDSPSLASQLSPYERGVTTVPAKKKGFVAKSREACLSKVPVVDELEEVDVRASAKRVEFIKSLSEAYPLDGVTDYIKFTVSAITSHFRNKPTFHAMTGRGILKRYLESFGKEAKKSYMGTDVTSYLLSDWDSISDYLLGVTNFVLASGDALEVFRSAFGNTERFYAGIVGIATGVGVDAMSGIADLCSRNNISFSKVVNESPYLLHLIGISFSDTEQVATCFGFGVEEKDTTMHNVAMLNNYCMNSEDGSTLFTIDSILRSQVGVTLTKAKYERMRDKGYVVSEGVYSNTKYYLKSSDSACKVANIGFRASGMNYIRPLNRKDLEKAIDDYVASGLGCKILDKYLISEHYLERELYVYNRLQKMGTHTYGYDHKQIDNMIDLYEESVGFKLEKEQRAAVHLCDFQASAVTGGAGSGKTTTSDCIVAVLSALEPMMDIKYGAPTGKAAKRLQEVIKKPVKTMHSLFRIGMEESNILSNEERLLCFDQAMYIFDENAMVTVDLLYNVLKRTNESSRFMFLGDINQLPPIGRGVPFKDMLRFLPCVALTVSKRAAEGSDITKNADILNNHSEPNDFLPIQSGKDFKLYECGEKNCIRVIEELCKYYLGKSTANNEAILCNLFHVPEMPKVPNLTADDIQIVTPIEKSTYGWGAIKLNEMLQPVFNPGRRFEETFILNTYTKVRIGDRVLHKQKNCYSMQWYDSYKDGEFRKVYGYGICNGEVGKVVACYTADECNFLPESEEMPEDFEYPQSMRDDSTWAGNFLVVEYYDYISDRNIYICYRCSDGTESPEGISLTGDDMALLSLFYAGTTHKLQGSQAKIVIAPLLPVTYSGFITRNMLYTAWTRGIDLVFVLGDVGNGLNSMLSRARRDVAGEDTLTLCSVLFDDCE